MTVLFTMKNSIYEKLGCDTWDEKRDARNYKGTDPIIAHPPCRLWGKLAHMAKAPEEEKELFYIFVA